MQKKGITTYQLIQQGIDRKIIHNLKHNGNITMLTAEKLCKIIGCSIFEVVEFIDD
jgi:DNA-binding Xre family transcriptional regulator